MNDKYTPIPEKKVSTYLGAEGGGAASFWQAKEWTEGPQLPEGVKIRGPCAVPVSSTSLRGILVGTVTIPDQKLTKSLIPLI